MPGTFAVAGIVVLPGRGLVAYGDIVSGDVRAGELLLIPLNSSIAMSPVIRSVEAVDGTATGSHVGLLLAVDELEIVMLRALGFEGETLAVSAAGVDGDAERTGFDEAKERLLDLLARVQWPHDIAWIDESHVTTFPRRVFVFLHHGRFEPENVARAKFEAAAATCPAVRLGAVGIARGKTLVAVRPIRELGQGEEMFIERGVKVDVPRDEPAVTVTKSRLLWRLIRRAYRKWIERRNAALGVA